MGNICGGFWSKASEDSKEELLSNSPINDAAGVVATHTHDSGDTYKKHVERQRSQLVDVVWRYGNSVVIGNMAKKSREERVRHANAYKAELENLLLEVQQCEQAEKVRGENDFFRPMFSRVLGKAVAGNQNWDMYLEDVLQIKLDSVGSILSSTDVKFDSVIEKRGIIFNEQESRSLFTRKLTELSTPMSVPPPGGGSLQEASLGRATSSFPSTVLTGVDRWRRKTSGGWETGSGSDESSDDAQSSVCGQKGTEAGGSAVIQGEQRSPGMGVG